jgi:hypothetical protein
MEKDVGVFHGHLVYIGTLWPSGIFYGIWVYLNVIWYIFPFG